MEAPDGDRTVVVHVQVFQRTALSKGERREREIEKEGGHRERGEREGEREREESGRKRGVTMGGEKSVRETKEYAQ